MSAECLWISLGVLGGILGYLDFHGIVEEEKKIIMTKIQRARKVIIENS
jgi:hypothetical protein